MRLKVSSAKRRPFCLGLNELSKQATLKDTATGFYVSTKNDNITTTKQNLTHISLDTLYSSKNDNITTTKQNLTHISLDTLYSSKNDDITKTKQNKTLHIFP